MAVNYKRNRWWCGGFCALVWCASGCGPRDVTPRHGYMIELGAPSTRHVPPSSARQAGSVDRDEKLLYAGAQREVTHHQPPAGTPAHEQTQCSHAPPTDPQSHVVRTLYGKASFYHDSLAGNKTANGEIYQPCLFTAAHRQLALGTWVRVVRVDTGQSVVVRVNDRGPFGHRERIVDLSLAAAEALNMVHAGVVDVRVEVLARGPVTTF